MALLLLSFLMVAVSAIIYTGGINIFITNYLQIIILSIFALSLLLTLYAFMFYQGKEKLKGHKSIVITYTIFFFTVVVAFLTMRFLSPYTAPIAMSAVMVGLLVSKSFGFISNAFATLVIAMICACMDFITTGVISVASLIGTLIAFMQSYCMMFLIKKNYSRFKLIWGAVAIGISFTPIAMLLSIIDSMQWQHILLAGVYSFVGNIIAVVVFTALLPMYEMLFNVWTDFKLAEACSVSRPLLQRLSNEAPGTFNHCIIVSNLCESCALAIGQNPYLAKACGIYHDVGKLKNPEFFVENQFEAYNPHNDIIPEASANLIINHTEYGYELLKENRLPEQIAMIAKEHHGTSIVQYFYKKARGMTEGDVDMELYQYNGPKPKSKISAIVMIADVVEAATRAKTPKTSEELRALIENLIKHKIEEDQFSDCGITFADLDVIKKTILKVIPSIYHKRIDYDTKKKEGV